jgi:NhaP-type Na+/H+ or K+/H+ antiporter
VLRSLVLSGIAFVVVTVLIEVPSRFLAPTSGALRYFLIGAAINGLRILALGTVIGLLHERLSERSRGQGPSSGTR